MRGARRRGIQNGALRAMEYTINSERLTAREYIEFLKTTDLGSQYPKERFHERIERLVKNAGISLVARDAEGAIAGVLFGLTDRAYWLFVTDLGVARAHTGCGIGSRLMQEAIVLAGGSDDIIVYTCANEDAVGFYEKQGMRFSRDVMEYNRVEWTPFTVE